MSLNCLFFNSVSAFKNYHIEWHIRCIYPHSVLKLHKFIINAWKETGFELDKIENMSFWGVFF